MSEAEAVHVVPRRRRSWWLIAVAVVVVVAIVLLVGQAVYFRHLADEHLRAAEAAVTAVDPRWRLVDLEADREAMPPEGNSADVALAARGKLPAQWAPPADLELPGPG